MSPTRPPKNASDWETAIGREREPRTFAADATALDVLRQRFRQISTRTREQRQSDWIDRPGFTTLRVLSDSALELTRLAFHELSQFDNPSAPTIPLPSLSQLLMENQSRLAEIDQRRRRVQSLVAIAEQLREPLEALIDTGSRHFGPWITLIREIQGSDLGQEAGGIGAVAAADVNSFLQSESWRHAWLYVPALQRAAWTVRVQHRLPEWQPYPIDVAALPALLADCGLLIQFPDRGRPTTTAPSPALPDYQRHPEIAAALLASIDHASPLSSLLAGQHHERGDGSGYPRRLRHHELQPVSRCFQVVARWSELLLSTGADSAADPRTEAARTLAREAWHGALDAQIVKRLLATVNADGPTQAVAAAGLESRGPQRPLDDSPARRRTPAETPSLVRIIDGPETVPPPAMWNSRVPAFKDDGPLARVTPPPRPAVSGYR